MTLSVTAGLNAIETAVIVDILSFVFWVGSFRWGYRHVSVESLHCRLLFR